jgi:hypothetical protein
MLPETNDGLNCNGRVVHNLAPPPVMSMREIRADLGRIIGDVDRVITELDRRLAADRAATARWRAKRRAKDELLDGVAGPDEEFEWRP